ncbi:hypothetical protein B0H19DRAFT_1084524 [Mycena capillaripes]|nr:hypothetical protein B0H19DRAFT_1084524 [Mycena capillaripes]
MYHLHLFRQALPECGIGALDVVLPKWKFKKMVDPGAGGNPTAVSSVLAPITEQQQQLQWRRKRQSPPPAVTQQNRRGFGLAVVAPDVARKKRLESRVPKKSNKITEIKNRGNRAKEKAQWDANRGTGLARAMRGGCDDEAKEKPEREAVARDVCSFWGTTPTHDTETPQLARRSEAGEVLARDSELGDSSKVTESWNRRVFISKP